MLLKQKVMLIFREVIERASPTRDEQTDANTKKPASVCIIIRASQKRKGRAAALLNIFYFSLYDIGMARKSAHRFGFHDFHNFKALNACAAR